MTRETLDQLLQRAKMREVPPERLSGYAEEVRRKLQAQPSTIIPVRPRLPWWVRVLAPVAVTVAALLIVGRFATPPAAPPHAPLQLAEVSLEDEAAILSAVAPEEQVLPGDEGALMEMEELETFEDDSAVRS